MKYVVYQDKIFGPTAVIGPETMVHTQLANACCDAPILSAGFCRLRARDGQLVWYVYGESLSLSKTCRAVDAEIIHESVNRNPLG